MIIRYFGQDYYFLSNNYRHPIYLLDEPIPARKPYKTVTHAFYASKLPFNTPQGVGYRTRVRLSQNPASVISYANTISSQDNWEDKALVIMEQLLRQKFTDKDMARRLRDTNPVELQYGNRQHDLFWGVCRCSKCSLSGENHLGKILMRIRTELLEM